MTLTTFFATTLELSHDPLVVVCWVGTLLCLVAIVVLSVKTMRLWRSIRVMLNDVSQGDAATRARVASLINRRR